MVFGTSPTLLTSLLALSIAHPAPTFNIDFENPGPEYRPKFRYWLPDASVSPAIVADDFQQAKAAGAGGLEFVPFYLYGMGQAPGLPDWAKYGFGTPPFVSLFRDALQAAEKNNITMDFALGANQAQGVLAEVSSSGLAVQLLLGNTTIMPNSSFSAPVPQARQPPEIILGGLGFMHPLEQFGTPNLTAVIAYQVLSVGTPDTSTGSKPVVLNQSSYIDLTPFVTDGWSLQWTPPDRAKTWKIFTFWESYTNQRSCDGGANATTWIGNGSWIVDHFSATGATKVTDFWDEYIVSDETVARLLRSVSGYAWEDSMEMLASLYWSPGLLNRFNITHGYELTPYLPLLFNPSNTWGGLLPMYDEVYGFSNDSVGDKNAYQLDYRDILNDGYQDYLSHFESWAHSVGAKYSTQPAYNLPLQMLSDIPLLDAPEGESLGFSQLPDAYRQFAGAAHLANKSVISSELGAVRVPPYSLQLPDVLQQVKRSLAAGFTMHVLHGYPFSGPYQNTTWPGYTTFFYQFTDMWNRVQPAWSHMKDVLDYVGRNQWVLQQGSPKVDLAFYLFASPWSPVVQYNSTNLERLGFTYDYVGPDNIVSKDAFVEGSKLGIPEYKALIFNEQTVVTIEAIDAVAEKTALGLPIIFIGLLPSQAYPVLSSPQNALTSAISNLLATKGVYQAASIEELPALLSKIGIKPRVSLNCSTGPISSVYRSADDVDYVYLFNDQSGSARCSATISASSVTPYSYNAWTGTQKPLLQHSASNSTISYLIELHSNETAIIALHHNDFGSQYSYTSSSDSLVSLEASNNSILALVTGPTVITSCTGEIHRLQPRLTGTLDLTNWNLVIEDWHSASDRLLIETEITNHRFINTTLVPWNRLVSPIDDSSLEKVSGIGHYTTEFTVPATPSNSSNGNGLFGVLKLPLIQNTARVYIDEILQPPVDPVKPITQLDGLVPGTTHRLRIEITTTLFNRIKAEANSTWVVGQVAGELQPSYTTLPFMEYGLVGGVNITWGEKIVVS